MGYIINGIYEKFFLSPTSLHKKNKLNVGFHVDLSSVSMIFTFYSISHIWNKINITELATPNYSFFFYFSGKDFESSFFFNGFMYLSRQFCNF